MINSRNASDNRNWHVIYTRPNFERKVASELVAKGIEFFMPSRDEVRQWHDRKKKMNVLVFPGYIFVRVNVREVYMIYAINGFVNFVSNEGHPDVISDELMSAIQTLLEGEFSIKTGALISGDKIKIGHGAFQGLEGILLEDRGESKVAVRVEVINQFIVVVLPAFSLEKVAV
ncbi:MAG: UpxY family transcription antiterminator [Cytophagales bacterium]|nr:UpxY family transcription antiterminator [Cytophagales bacterium]